MFRNILSKMDNFLTLLIIILRIDLFQLFQVNTNFSDTCDYDDCGFPCGDICLHKLGAPHYPEEFGICDCGGEEFQLKSNDWNIRYCCAPPSVKCKRTLLGASCPEGEILHYEEWGSPPCYGRCFNDYLTSEYLSTLSQYTCPDTCVPNSAMCRAGVSFCDGDQEVCGEDLRCPKDNTFNDYNMIKHTMPTDPPRSFCFGWEQITGDPKAHPQATEDYDGFYDNIDRHYMIEIETWCMYIYLFCASKGKPSDHS